MVTSESENPTGSLDAEKTRLAQTLNYRAASAVFPTHRNAVEIIDKRAKFY
jgi:hypothetical protein